MYDIETFQNKKQNVSQRDGNSSKFTCKHCGFTTHNSEKCRFKNVMCNTCGHMAQVCRLNQVRIVQIPKMAEENQSKEKNINFCYNYNLTSFNCRNLVRPIKIIVTLNSAEHVFELELGAAIFTMSLELVPILKPDGTFRICADYKVTVNKFK